MWNTAFTHLIGRVVAAYRGRDRFKTVPYFSGFRLPSVGSEAPASRDFAKLNLHIDIFEQPEENHFFRDFLVILELPPTAESDRPLHKPG